MKQWLTIVGLLQLAMVILDALQFIAALQPALWIARWSLGLPGSILGQWAAERWLWHSGASMREIGICGLVLAVIFNMALAWAIARLSRCTRRALRRED